MGLNKEYFMAYEILKLLIKSEPTESYFHGSMGMILSTWNDCSMGAAYDHFTTAINLLPTFPQHRFYYGLALYKKGITF